MENKKQLTLSESTMATSDGRCAFSNSFWSTSVQEKEKAISKYHYHMNRRFEYPYSEKWIIGWIDDFKSI